MKSLFSLRMVQGEGSESHEDTPFLGRGMFTSSSLNTPEIPAERTPASIDWGPLLWYVMKLTWRKEGRQRNENLQELIQRQKQDTWVTFSCKLRFSFKRKLPALWVCVCFFNKTDGTDIWAREKLKKQEPKAARKIIKVNTPFDKRESKIKNDNRHDRRDYAHCCRGHFSSPPGGKRE